MYHLDPTLNIAQVVFHPSGACVGVATTGGTVRIYDIRQAPFLEEYLSYTDYKYMVILVTW